jgi:hypothetical protein
MSLHEENQKKFHEKCEYRNMGFELQKKCYRRRRSLTLIRVSLFRFKKKDAKRSEKNVKTNSKLARLSEIKRNKVRMPQFRLHEPLKSILTHKETCEKFSSFACFASFRNFFVKRKRDTLTLMV